jgi:regulator of protease activity HflC (stomatin/prohibitin superfamily)
MPGLGILLFFALIVVIFGLRVVNQYERKVLFTL